MRTRAEVGSSEWFGEIPDCWEMVPTSQAFSIAKGATVTKADLVESGTPVVNYGQVHSKANSGTHLSEQLVRHVPDGFLPDGLTPASRGSFIFASTSEDLAGCGACVYNDSENIVWPGGDTCVLTPESSTENKYFAYLFATDAWRFQIRRDLVDVKVFHVNKGNLNDTYVVVPPKNEQHRIVAFLDEHCAAIDADIAKRREVIEKLDEYKKAVITKSVTKGLDPDVAMKDSGIKWVGVIPCKWDVRKIKHLFEIRKRIAGKEGFTVLSITQKGIIPKDLTPGQGQLAENYSGYQLVYPGDYAMNHMDLLTGWVDVSRYEGVTSPDYRVFCLLDDERDDRYFFNYVFQACYFNKTFFGSANGIADKGRMRLQTPAFKEFCIPVPPTEEQRRIAAFLDERCSTIDEAISLQEQLITKLEEYRKSLIHHTVTGKIDCREA